MVYEKSNHEVAMNNEMQGRFGRLMRRARTDLKVTLRELQSATKGRDYPTGISIGLLSMLESGERTATYGICLKISTILSIELETAMAAAYRDRVEYSAERERASMEAFFKTKKALRKLDPIVLTQRPEWRAGD